MPRMPFDRHTKKVVQSAFRIPTNGSQGWFIGNTPEGEYLYVDFR